MLPLIDPTGLSVSTLQFLPELIVCLAVVLLLLVPLLADARRNVLLALGLPLVFVGVVGVLVWLNFEELPDGLRTPRLRSFFNSYWSVFFLVVLTGLLFLLSLLLRVSAGKGRPVNVAPLALILSLVA